MTKLHDRTGVAVQTGPQGDVMSDVITLLPPPLERQRRTIWRMFETGRLSADTATTRLLRLGMDPRWPRPHRPAADPIT